MVELAAYYRGKRVLVTGDTGFKGSWLVTWLLHLGADVVGYALPPEGAQDNYVRCGLAQRITHLDADVRDYARLASVVAEHRPDVVFHLAAQALVLESYRTPRETFDTNIMGTVNLLEAVRHVRTVAAVVVVTSDKCYENQDWVWGYRETDPMGGHDPYSASKGAAEIVTAAMRRSFFGSAGAAAVASARAGNVIGAGDWAANRIVPDCMRALFGGEAIAVRNPHAVRPWQHVLDALHGYLQLGARIAADRTLASGWNFGPPQNLVVPVQTLVDAVLARWGSGSAVPPPPADAPAPKEARLLHLDISKARSELGWRPTLDLDQVVAMTVEGYRAERDAAADLFAHRSAQVRAFEELARG